ncbi:MAG TPA: SLAC1 anion channel family protein [Candidatus Competibacteraceae bacterium]|nr:SLAC1 anion channel family protein [Candidatus Competibacteraceae bacterium]MCP5132314.1 SLAC1 anion channel family protein [Gammaproteobacteria bacterium]HPF58661.1 SLAC1 anion channel family protein [Candidatus Competibacteraceae bacterium]HRX71888.1 SLAC1 anion channel family protein [Candidatus Competibacteraceae bacterium]
MSTIIPASSASTAPLGQESASHRLEHFPIAIFSIVMGTAGLALAWQKAHLVLGTPLIIGAALRGTVSALFVVLLIVYGLKALRYPQAVGMEMRHPVRINFFPTVSISLLLLAIAYLESAPEAAFWLWSAGALLHLGLTLAIFGSWLHHTHYDVKHANPAWFIPVVGNIIIPIAGIHLASPELSWFFFSIGLVFWIVLLTIVLYRLFFHEPLPVRLAPTLFILLAPPSVGFIAYLGLTGELDAFARILYYTALFLALLLASNAVRFLRLPFFISAWAYSFPLAALTLATLIMSARLPGPLFDAMATGLLALLSLVVAVLALRTVIAVQRREICIPE